MATPSGEQRIIAERGAAERGAAERERAAVDRERAAVHERVAAHDREKAAADRELEKEAQRHKESETETRPYYKSEIRVKHQTPLNWGELNNGIKLAIGLVLLACALGGLSRMLSGHWGQPYFSSYLSPNQAAWEKEMGKAGHKIDQFIENMGSSGSSSGWTSNRVSNLRRLWDQGADEMRKRVMSGEGSWGDSINSISENLNKMLSRLSSPYYSGVSGAAYRAYDTVKDAIIPEEGFFPSIKRTFGVGKEGREALADEYRGKMLGMLTGDVRDAPTPTWTQHAKDTFGLGKGGFMDKAKHAMGYEDDERSEGLFDRAKHALHLDESSRPWFGGGGGDRYGSSEGMWQKGKRAMGTGEEYAGQAGESMSDAAKHYSSQMKHHGRDMQREARPSWFG